MSRFQGSLRLPDETGPGLSVTLDLVDDRLVVNSAVGTIGDWSLEEIGVRGEDDGFHLRVEGEEVVVTTDDDAAFALRVGLQSASPRMRRIISAALRG